MKPFLDETFDSLQEFKKFNGFGTEKKVNIYSTFPKNFSLRQAIMFGGGGGGMAGGGGLLPPPEKK